MPVSEGQYAGTPELVRAAQLDNEKETDYLAIQFLVEWTLEGGEWVPIEPFRREVRLFLTDKAIPYTVDKLERLGCNVDDLADRLEAAHEDTGDMCLAADDVEWSERVWDEGIELTCRHDHRDGNTYENWALGGDSGHEPGAASNEALGGLRKEWESRRRKKRGGRRTKKGRSKKQRKEPDDSPVRDDEIPEVDEEVEDVPEEDIPF